MVRVCINGVKMVAKRYTPNITTIIEPLRDNYTYILVYIRGGGMYWGPAGLEGANYCCWLHRIISRKRLIDQSTYKRKVLYGELLLYVGIYIYI